MSLGVCVLSVSLLSPFATGISGKSQILFALVFTTRYLDLFTTFISIYNTVMKVRGMGCHLRGTRQAPADGEPVRLSLRLWKQADLGLNPGFAVSSCGTRAWAKLLAFVYLGFLGKMKIVVLTSEDFVVKIK